MNKFDGVYPAGALLCIFLAVIQTLVRNGNEWTSFNRVTLLATVVLAVFFVMKSKKSK